MSLADKSHDEYLSCFSVGSIPSIMELNLLKQTIQVGNLLFVTRPVS